MNEQRSPIILIVEDCPTTRQILALFLEAFGPCDTVPSSEAGTTVTQAFESGAPYQIICLNIPLAELDAQELLGQLRDLEQSHGVSEADRAKIAMTTALAEDDETRQALAQQCDGCVTKPVRRAELLSALGLSE